VSLALEARHALIDTGVATRVVSMPSWEVFREQDTAYRNEVLPPSVRNRLAIEAGVALGWKEWVGDSGDVVSIDTFGASAPAGELLRQYGFSVENVVARARRVMEGI
jgi:transketolase